MLDERQQSAALSGRCVPHHCTVGSTMNSTSSIFSYLMRWYFHNITMPYMTDTNEYWTFTRFHSAMFPSTVGWGLPKANVASHACYSPHFLSFVVVLLLPGPGAARAKPVQA